MNIWKFKILAAALFVSLVCGGGLWAKAPVQKELWTAVPKNSDRPYVIAKMPNDPLQSNQKYLQQIGADAAWNEATGNTAITVAVVDTGVDLKHPDLIPNLVPGVNLIKPDRPPDDENGHGTNVAGVIAAAADNDKGIAGLLWHAKIMPIKALESDGTGEEGKLGEGIRYAVDHGARIVVLSLGLNKPSAYLEEIVRYAESKDVLLVAASGNEGAAVKYPAAYPTVLAVGGATANNQAVALSNFGPELDIVAPWTVFTTFRGGKYNYASGTSLAAPQAAAVCALLLSKYPGLKPYQIRSMIRQSAEDLGSKGWDPHTGYGLLRADRAMTMPYKEDMYENNNRLADAAVIPIDKQIDAAVDSPGDSDWYSLDVPYSGTLNVQLRTESPGDSMILTDLDAGTGKETPYRLDLDKGVEIRANAGKHYLKVSGSPARGSAVYHLTARFTIGPDAFEDNDKAYKAFTLAPRSQTITGTFHASDDQDWYSMYVEQPGTLRLKASTDTSRIDLALSIRRGGGKETRVDLAGDGEPEVSPVMEVQPGTYYFHINNTNGDFYPAAGQYELDLEYAQDNEDPNEPNDKPYQATSLHKDMAVQGSFDSLNDTDWFQLKLVEESDVDLLLTRLQEGVNARMTLLDQTLGKVEEAAAPKAASQRIHTRLKAGTYYVKLTSDRAMKEHLYRLVWQDAKP